MTVYIGADHRGYQLKEALKSYFDSKGIEYLDLGCFSESSVDYPDIAREVVEKILENEGSRGILICDSGVGMSMAANRYKKIRAALCFNEAMAEMCRRHNNANVLCLGAAYVSKDLAERMVEVFLHTEFEGGRHECRVKMFDETTFFRGS